MQEKGRGAVVAGGEQRGGAPALGPAQALSSCSWQSCREKDIKYVTSALMPDCHSCCLLPREVQGGLLEHRVEVCLKVSRVRGPCGRKAVGTPCVKAPSRNVFGGIPGAEPRLGGVRRRREQ